MACLGDCRLVAVFSTFIADFQDAIAKIFVIEMDVILNHSFHILEKLESGRENVLAVQVALGVNEGTILDCLASQIHYVLLVGGAQPRCCIRNAD